MFKRGADLIIRRCVPKGEQSKFYRIVMHHHMEDILQEKKKPTKFSSLDFIGLLFSRTVLNVV